MSDEKPLGLDIPAGMVWSYRQTIRGGTLTHTWTLVGDKGGIHVDAWLSAGFGSYGPEWVGGIECHTPPADGQSPHHEHCWLLDGPCVHDGSSLQFREDIAPLLPNPYDHNPQTFGHHVHGYVLHNMQHRYRLWIVDADSK